MFGRGFAEGAAVHPMEHLYFDQETPMPEHSAHPSADARTPRTFRLAGWHVEPSLNRATRDGTSLQIEPKVMQVLEVLVENAGHVVLKDSLISRVWDGVFVTDDALVRAVGELRKVFEAGVGGTAVIETIRKRGYRLVAPVIFDLGVDGARPFSIAPAPASVVAKPASRRRLWLAAGALLTLVAALAVWSLARRPAAGKAPAATLPRFLPFTTLDGNEYVPAVSPDGTRIAFGWSPAPEAPRDLYVRLIGDENMLRLTNDAAEEYGVTWSEDGTQISYLSMAPGGCAVMSVAALGGTPRRLADCEQPRARFAVSPDGRETVITKQLRPGWNGRLFVRVRGEPDRLLLPAEPGDFVDSAPAYSPDGRWLAFSRWLSDSVGDIFVVSARGGGVPRRLTTDNADTMGFTWAGNEHILFSSNRAGMYSLWSVGLEGGQPALVAGGGRKIKHPSASRDGSLVAYEAWNYDMNLAALEAPFGAGAPRALATATDEWTFEPRLSADGTRIVFTSTRSGAYEIWTSAADGSNALRLTRFGGPYVGAPRIAPDGKSVVFVARPEGQADVYVVDIAGGEPRRLTTDAADDVAPAFGADGQRVYFASRRTGDWQIHVVGSGGGEPAAVTTQGGYAALAHDGWVYHSRSDRAGLWRRRENAPPTEASELVDESWPAGDSSNFGLLADGRVYWVAPATDAVSAKVMTRRVEEAAVPLVDLPGMAWSGVDVAPDGRRVLYARIGRNDSNIVVMQRPR